MQTLELGEARVAYWDVGTGPSIVFIHGAATLGELWAADLAELASDFRIIAYDRRGYGGSSASPGSWEAHRDDAIGLIEALGAAPACVVGYSAGSMIALDLAMRRPELVRSIVLLDPAFNLRRCLTPGLVRAIATTRILRAVAGERHAATHWLRYVSSYSTGGSAFEARASAERKEKLLANAGGIFADFAQGGGRVDEDGLASIAVPITLVEAALSPSFLRRSCARLVSLLPRARRVTLARSGHWAGLDARDELLPILREAARFAPAAA